MADHDSIHPPHVHAPLDLDELDAWLRVVETPGIGAITIRRLLARFGLPDAVLAASRERLLEVVTPAVAMALHAKRDAHEALVQLTHRWNVEAEHHVLTLADRRYPAALLEIEDPPPLLYVCGRVDRLQRPGLAVVGSRDATPQGRLDARRIARAAATAGLTIVSGLALGIDAAAHEGALDAGDAGASTVAVIGTGPDIVYPASHRELAHRIAAHGALVGEFALGTRVAAHRFPRRNRIIAGLARGVLVVEAATRSGSLITARLAAETGRDVFAVPGSIHSPLSKGCHALLRQGAKLVESVDDVLEELGAERDAWTDRIAAAAKTVEADHDDGDTNALLDAIGHAPTTIDELVDRCAQPVARIASMLLALELDGRVARLPGGKVQRLVTA